MRNQQYYSCCRLYKITLRILVFFMIFMWGSTCFCKDIRMSVNIFKNLTGEPKNDWMGVGLADNIIVNLRGTRGLQLVEIEQLNKLFDVMKLSLAGLTDEKTAIKTVKYLGVQYMIVGSLQIADDELVVNYRMVEVETGAILFSDMASGKLKDIISVEKKVGKKIVKGLKAQFPELCVTLDDFQAPVLKTTQENYSQGMMCAFKSESRKAIACYQKAIDDDPDAANAYLGQGEMYLREKNASSALERLNIALSIYLGKKDKFFTGWTYYKIGEVYYFKGDYEQADRFYKIALKIKKKIGNDIHIPSIYLKLSKIAHQKGQLKEAVKYAKRSVKENAKFKNKLEQIEPLTNLAMLYRESNQLPLANKTLQIVKGIEKEIEVLKK